MFIYKFASPVPETHDKLVSNATKPVMRTLCHPWRRFKCNEDTEETIYDIERLKYKIYTDIGFSSKSTESYTHVLDTGDASSFIFKRDFLQERNV